MVLLSRWSDDVSVSKLPAAKQMEKFTSQPKLDGRPGVTENFRGEKSHGMPFFPLFSGFTRKLVLFTNSSNELARIISADPTNNLLQDRAGRHGIQ